MIKNILKSIFFAVLFILFFGLYQVETAKAATATFKYKDSTFIISSGLVKIGQNKATSSQIKQILTKIDQADKYIYKNFGRTSNQYPTYYISTPKEINTDHSNTMAKPDPRCKPLKPLGYVPGTTAFSILSTSTIHLPINATLPTVIHENLHLVQIMGGEWSSTGLMEGITEYFSNIYLTSGSEMGQYYEGQVEIARRLGGYSGGGDGFLKSVYFGQTSRQSTVGDYGKYAYLSPYYYQLDIGNCGLLTVTTKNTDRESIVTTPIEYFDILANGTSREKRRTIKFEGDTYTIDGAAAYNIAKKSIDDLIGCRKQPKGTKLKDGFVCMPLPNGTVTGPTKNLFCDKEEASDYITAKYGILTNEQANNLVINVTINHPELKSVSDQLADYRFVAKYSTAQGEKTSTPSVLIKTGGDSLMNPEVVFDKQTINIPLGTDTFDNTKPVTVTLYRKIASGAFTELCTGAIATNGQTQQTAGTPFTNLSETTDDTSVTISFNSIVVASKITTEIFLDHEKTNKKGPYDWNTPKRVKDGYIYRISNLSPGTTYWYGISMSGPSAQTTGLSTTDNYVSGLMSFTTQPVGGSSIYSNIKSVPTDTMAEISWDSSIDTTTTHIYVYTNKELTGTPKDYTYVSQTNLRNHKTTISELLPGTIYWYRLSTAKKILLSNGKFMDDDNLSGIMSFTTLANSNLESDTSIDLKLTGNGNSSDFLYNNSTIGVEPIKISATITPKNTTVKYTATLYVSENDHSDEKDTAAANEISSTNVKKVELDLSGKVQSFDYTWDVANSSLGYHSILLSVSGDDGSVADTRLWIKLMNGEVGTIRLDLNEQNAMPGTNIEIGANINGLFPVGTYTYKAYVAMHPSTVAPTANVGDANTWVLYNATATNNTFQVTAADANSPFVEYTLPTVTWTLDNNKEFGTRYIKIVIFDKDNKIISSDTGFVNVNASILPISLTADGGKDMTYDKVTSTADSIKIVGTLTPESITSAYNADLYITKEGYSSNVDLPTNLDDFQLVASKTFDKISSAQTLEFDWKPKDTDSKTGIHEVVYKVYGADLPATGQKLIIWIKICKNGVCTPEVVVKPCDTSTLNLESAAADALGLPNIKVNFKNFGSVVTFLKDKWFPTIVGIFAFLGIIYSAWLYIMSAGDQAKADKGKKGLVYSVIGIAIAVGANVIINVSNSVISTYNNSTSIYGGGNSLFTKATNMIAMISGMLAFLYLIYSGILYLTASGNPDNAKKGLQGVINAAIGIVIIVAAWAIIGAVTGTLGAYFK